MQQPRQKYTLFLAAVELAEIAVDAGLGAVQLLGDVAHRALEEEHALAAQRLHDVHLLILCQAVDLHGVVRHDGGDDARRRARDGRGIGLRRGAGARLFQL